MLGVPVGARAVEVVHQVLTVDDEAHRVRECRVLERVSRQLATMGEVAPVCRVLVDSSRQLVSLRGGAVVLADEAQTRYVLQEVFGWAKSSGRAVLPGEDKDPQVFVALDAFGMDYGKGEQPSCRRLITIREQASAQAAGGNAPPNFLRPDLLHA